MVEKLFCLYYLSYFCKWCMSYAISIHHIQYIAIISCLTINPFINNY